MSAVSLSGVSKSFRSGLVGGKVAALQSVDLDVMPGEILGLVGPNGAGKSTLLLIIAGMLRADKGQVVVGGHEVHLGGSRAVGYAPERPAFEMSLTAEQMLVSLAKLRGQRGRDARLAAHRALETVRLEHEGRRRIRTLSGGMLQRLALAQALIGQPRLLLMDETLSGLDPVVHRDVCEVTREMPNHGTTVMLSSHDLSTIQQLANRVIVIASGTVRGAIAAADLSTPAELQRRFFELIGTRPLRAVS